MIKPKSIQNYHTKLNSKGTWLSDDTSSSGTSVVPNTLHKSNKILNPK